MRRATIAAIVSSLLVAALPGGVAAAGNTPPVAVDDPSTATCNSDSFGGALPIPEDWGDFALALGCAPTVNDSDVDGDTLTLELVGEPAHGEATVLPESNWIVYHADPDFSTIAGNQPGGVWVSDTIQYRLFDGTDYSNTASYRVWIAPINDAPTFTPGDAIVETHVGDGAVSIPWATDVSPGPGASEAGQHVTFQFTSVSTNDDAFAVDPAIAADGTLTFTPGTQPWLSTFTVRAKDDGGLTDYGIHDANLPPPDDTSDEVTFNIVVWPADPAAPVAVTDELQVTEDTPVHGFLPLANDSDVNGDDFSITEVGAAGKGTPTLTGLPGTVDYVPNEDATGADSFTYTVEDSTGRSSTGTVNVTISPVNDVPVAADDEVDVAEGSGPNVVDVLVNDNDVDGDTLAVIEVSDPAHGTATLNGGVVRYAPDTGYVGPDSFQYVLDDGTTTDTATVSVTVAPDTVAPVVDGLVLSIAIGTIGSTTVPVRPAWHGTDPAPASGLASYELQVQVNGGAWNTVALPSPTGASPVQQVAVGSTFRFRVRATDARGNASGYATSATSTVQRPQEGAGSIAWRGSWTRGTDPRFSGGASRFTSGTGRRATLTFTGRGIAWVSRTSPTAGRAEVWIDGVKVAAVDLGVATAWRRVVFRRDLPTGGSHTIQVRPLGDGRVDIDAFVVLR